MATRLDKLVAILAAGLINILFAILLLYGLRSTRPSVDDQYDRLKLTWIVRSIKDKKDPLPAASLKRQSVATSELPAKNIAEEPSNPLSETKQPTTKATVIVTSDDSWEESYTNNASTGPVGSFQRPIVRSESDNLSGKRILPKFNMQDSSVMGKLSRMGRVSECGELRAALRRSASNGASLDVIIRSMQARGCKI